MRCANAWGCPVCAAIISEHRKNEVKEAMDWWKKQCGSVLLLTLTVPHYSDTDIKQLKKDLKKAYSKFFKGVRASKDMFERWQIKHYISCFEITHGENGFHVRIITFSYLFLIPLVLALILAWKKIFIRFGLTAAKNRA